MMVISYNKLIYSVKRPVFLVLSQSGALTFTVRLCLLQAGERLRATQQTGDGKPREVSFQPGQCVPNDEAIHRRLGKRRAVLFQKQPYSKYVISILMIMLIMMMTITMMAVGFCDSKLTRAEMIKKLYWRKVCLCKRGLN